MSGIPPGMNPIAIGNGGTNATTAPQALANLGAIGVDSPAFTGTPTAPTPPLPDNSTRLATTAFVKGQGFGVGTITGVAAGAGLTGGGTSGSVSLALTAGVNPNVGAFQGLTLDTYGRVTGAANQNYLTGITSGQVTGALGFTPLSPANNLSELASKPTALATLGGAPLASPTFTGTVTAPALTLSTTPLAIASGGTNATTAPTALTSLGAAPLDSPAFTGAPSLPTGTVGVTQTAGNSTTALATTAFVAVSFAPLASPIFTGVPVAPTAALATNTTQLATTAYSRTLLTSRAAAATSTPADPAGVTSTVGVMAGYAQTLTPQVTGRLLIIFSGSFSNSTSGTGFGAGAQLRYGTGTAPIHGAALTGTAVGQETYYTCNAIPSLNVPFSISNVVTGLTVGTTYWIDLAQYAIGGGSASIFNSMFMALEV
jgi:hypothetical protein